MSGNKGIEWQVFGEYLRPRKLGSKEQVFNSCG
jgi:hypothetical protein